MRATEESDSFSGLTVCLIVGYTHTHTDRKCNLTASTVSTKSVTLKAEHDVSNKPVNSNPTLKRL